VEETGIDFAAQFVQVLIASATEAEESHLSAKRRSILGALCKQDDDLVVNLGYAKYQGHSDPAAGLSYWKRVSAPATAALMFFSPC
jgi:hypothetical protein